MKMYDNLGDEGMLLKGPLDQIHKVTTNLVLEEDENPISMVDPTMPLRAKRKIWMIRFLI